MSPRERQSNGVKIVHIEDNPENRLLVRALLEAEGYTIVDAEDGLSGIETALREQPALILLDMNLPDVEGYEVGAVLKSFPTLATIPIVAVTAYAMEGDRQRTLVAGCDGYIQKPIDPDRFPRQVAEFLRGKRERLEEREEGPYLRELNQRLVYRFVTQVEELKRLNQTLLDRAHQLEELARIARMLTESLDAADVGERIVESALLLIGGRFSVLRLLRPDGALEPIAARGEGMPLDAIPVLRPDMGMTGRAVREGHPVWSSDVLAEEGHGLPEDVQQRMTKHGMRAYLAAPLMVKREIVGVLGIGAELGRAFSEAEVALLRTFADQAAIALENSRLYGELRTALKTVEESQQRIVQGERLRALGEMAGGVAHDFNNTLAIIVGRAEVLLEDVRDVELQRQLNVIIKIALDAAQTVRRIQDFTRMRRSRPFQSVNLGELAEEIVDVTRSRWKDEAAAKGLRYDVVVEPVATPPVSGDPSEIREALTNIIFNALDAMPDGGHLTIRTGVEGDRVVCAVTDTGIGMPDDVKQRVFDPFFTTKGERGTGLGLSVVYGIVTRHGGDVEVESQPGQGSTFFLRFPVAGDTASAVPSPPTPAVDGKARVLVVDDERDVREILSQLLSRAGHTVEMAQDGDAVVAQLQATAFDLVITDLGMPSMSGWDVARLVKERRPGTPVAMITGWGDRIDLVEAGTRGVDYVLAKPFTRDGVFEILASALAAAAPTR